MARPQQLRQIDPGLIEYLGKDFVDVLDFYIIVEKEILPLLTEATSSITGIDLAPIYEDQNSNLRLIDYFPSSNSTRPRCGEHRDYEAYTITFQDGSVSGLEYEIDGQWAPVPTDVDAVVSLGWCSAILSNDRVKATKHRVLKMNWVQKRQTTVNIFVAPDLDVVLKPIEEGSGKRSGLGGFWKES